MKLIGFVVALLGVLEPAAAAEKGLKKKINEKIGNLNSFYWRPNENEPKVLCGMCRDKTDQDMNAKCNYKTGNCPEIPNGERCMKGKFLIKTTIFHAIRKILRNKLTSYFGIEIHF